VLHKLRINLSVEGFEEKREAPAAVRLPEDFALLYKATDDLDKQALRYVLRRGITKEQVKDSKLGVSFSGRYAYRVIFPALAGGKLKAFTARDFTGTSKVRYLGTPGDKWLFRFDSKAETIVLSEGVFKALRIAQVTSWGSASLLGHAISSPQLEQIKSSGVKRVMLYPDPDAVGVAGFLNIAEKLIQEWGGKVLIAETVENPADEDPLETLQKNLQNLTPYSWSLKYRLLNSTT
jgi:DNA primase